MAVLPANGDVRPGDVVLISGRSGLVLHRVVHLAWLAGELRVFHRGDGRGRLGLTPRPAVVGRAVTIVTPPARSLPDLAGLDAAARRRFRNARTRSRIYALFYGAADRTGLLRWPPARAAGRLIQRALL